MYYPYFRGKQFELILLRDNAELISRNNFHPIIEPVKENFAALIRSANTLNEKEVTFSLIVNPQVPQKSVHISRILSELLDDAFKEYKNIYIGYILNAKSDPNDFIKLIEKYSDRKFTIIHNGYTEGKNLNSLISDFNNIANHIFIEGFAGKLYQRQFKQVGVNRVLIRNGFKAQIKNANYPPSEHFSDLHITYPDERMDGYGDYLIVGDGYSETGGPAYAVAIHTTYLDEDDDMYIYHFLSDQTDSPTDPGGKFLEALKKLIKECQKEETKIFKSAAIREFFALFDKKHYPGLGYVKKLSMQHHLELMEKVKKVL